MLRSRLLTWIGALAALFMVTGVPWVVYATAARTQSVAAPLEEEREDHDERDERESVEATAPPPPHLAASGPRETVLARMGAHAALRPPTPACPTITHPSKFSVRRLI